MSEPKICEQCEKRKAQFRDSFFKIVEKNVEGKEGNEKMEDETVVVRVVHACRVCHRQNVANHNVFSYVTDKELSVAMEKGSIPASKVARKEKPSDVNFPHAYVFPWDD